MSNLATTLFPSRLLIDDFQDGNSIITLNGSSDAVKQECVTASVPGQTRFTWLHLITNRFSNDATARVANGVFSHSNGAGTYSEVQLDYGYGCSQPALKPLHLDLTPWTHFKLHFLANDATINLNALVYSGGGAFYAQGGINHPASSGPSVAVLEFSQFSVAFPASFKWNDVDCIVFLFQRASGGIEGSDFALDFIEASFL